MDSGDDNRRLSECYAAGLDYNVRLWTISKQTVT